MKKSAKSKGISSILILSTWIMFVLLGTGLLEGIYSKLGITQTMILGISGLICLWFLKWQFLWAIEVVADDKTLDNNLSIIPVIAIVLSLVIVLVSIFFLDSNRMGSEKIFWVVNFIMFSFTWWIDFSVGTRIGNNTLTLKSVETRTDI